MGSIINISGTFSPPTHVPDCLMGMARIRSEPFLFNLNIVTIHYFGVFYYNK